MKFLIFCFMIVLFACSSKNASQEKSEAINYKKCKLIDKITKGCDD